jgi:hypothetical protein
MRENFVASLGEQAQQQLFADISEKVKLDEFLTASIKKKGLKPLRQIISSLNAFPILPTKRRHLLKNSSN